MDDYGRQFWANLFGYAVGLEPDDTGVQRCVNILTLEMKRKDIFICLPREEIESYDEIRGGKGEVHHRTIYVFDHSRSTKIEKSVDIDDHVKEHTAKAVERTTYELGRVLATHLFDRRTREPTRTVRKPRDEETTP